MNIYSYERYNREMCTLNITKNFKKTIVGRFAFKSITCNSLTYFNIAIMALELGIYENYKSNNTSRITNTFKSQERYAKIIHLFDICKFFENYF